MAAPAKPARPAARMRGRMTHASWKVCLLALAVVAVGAVAAAPTAAACGFEEEHHVGPVEWGMNCSKPYVELHPEDTGDILP